MSDVVRVLHMIGSLDCGGSQMMIINLYKAIDKSRVQFDFVIDHSDQREFAHVVESLGAKIYEMPTFKGTNIAEVKAAWNQFFTQHPEYKIFHTHVRSYASLFLPIAKKHGLITIAHSHSTSNGKGISAAAKDVMQLPIRRQADYFFGCSKEAGEWLFGKKAVNSSRYHMLPNAIDAKNFQYDKSTRDRIRTELEIEDTFVVGHVGRLTEPKNHTFIVNVFAEVLKRRTNSMLLLVGDGELREKIINQCDDLGIRKNVIFLGNRNNVKDYYQAMDVFVFPSLWEGLGIAAVEAQAAGLPCVVSDQVPNQADIGAGLIQYLPLTDSTSDWCNAILSTRSKERQDMSEQVIRVGYDIADNAKWLQEFYLEIVGQGEEK